MSLGKQLQEGVYGMKRIITLYLAVCVVLSIVACGTKQDNPKESSSTPTETTAAPTSTPTDAPTESSPEVPTDVFTKSTDAKQTAQTAINVRPSAKPIATKLTKPTTEPSTPTTKPTSAPTTESTAISTTTPATAPTTLPTIEPSKEPLRQQKPPYDDFLDEYGSYEQICNSFGAAWDSEVSLDVPIYYEEEILGSVPHYHLSKDSSFTLSLAGEYGNGSITQFYHFPTNAMRLRPDGSSYLVYDTETEYRLYVFVTNYYYLMGYPIVINKDRLLSRDDFDDIQVGDSIETVASVDGIMELYKKVLYDDYYIPIVFENRKKVNNPVVSVHYLTDGILRIEYAMPEEGTIVVANLEFFEDYMIPTADGKLTSHKIKDIDLPVS